MTDQNQTPNNDPNIKPFMSHEVKLNPSNWHFTVSGPEFDDQKYVISFRSFEDARAEIEKRVLEAQKIAAKNVTLDLSILDEKGNPQRITRINRNTSDVSGIETRYFYPNVDWIKEALQRQARLYIEIRDISTALQPFQMSKSIGHGIGRIDASNYAVRVERLKQEFQEKARLAVEKQEKSLEEVNLEPNKQGA